MKKEFKIKYLLIIFVLILPALVLGVAGMPRTEPEINISSPPAHFFELPPEASDLKPEPKFITPLPKELKEEIEIEMEIESALKVEFYLRKIESLILSYLGQGIKEENIWKFSFDSRNIPNGNYFLILRIENQYGYYEKEITIEIKNEIEKDELKEEELKKEIEIKKKEIESQEKEIKAKMEEVKTEILNEAKESSKKIIETLPETKKEELEKEIEKIQSIIEKEVPAEIEKLTENEKEKIKKETQLEEEKKEEKEIIKEIELILEESKELLEKKPKAEFQEPLIFLKEDNERKLIQKKELRKEINKEITSLSYELEKTEKKIEEIKEKIEKQILEPIEIFKEEEPEIKQRIKKEVESLQFKTEEKLKELEEVISQKEGEKQEILAEVLKDSDGDGLSDEEELRIGINPFRVDSDNDGFLDSIEIEEGFDPLTPSPAEKIVYEEPPKSKAPISENYKIERIEMVKLPIGEDGLKIQGKGLPNTFITIYVYSLPFLVLITKTDANGNFVYILDKPLAKGHHQIYIAITDNKGKIKERSEVFNFIQTETAVAAILPPYIPEEVISPTESLSQVYTLLVVSLIIFSLGLALFIIGILTHQKRKIS